MKTNILALEMVGVLCGCGGGDTDSVSALGRTPTAEVLGDMELWKLDLMLEDRAANNAVQQNGPSSWSTYFAPDGSVIRPGIGEIRGREAIHDAFMADVYANALAGLTWTPERGEVSRAGDMGYTVGRYVATMIDTTGARTTVPGMYVRIWARQPDDTWKVEWEIRTPAREPEAPSETPSGDGSDGGSS